MPSSQPVDTKNAMQNIYIDPGLPDALPKKLYDEAIGQT